MKITEKYWECKQEINTEHYLKNERTYGREYVRNRYKKIFEKNKNKETKRIPKKIAGLKKKHNFFFLDDIKMKQKKH